LGEKVIQNKSGTFFQYTITVNCVVGFVLTLEKTSLETIFSPFALKQSLVSHTAY